MPLQTQYNEWNWSYRSHQTRPTHNTMGALVTPAQNAYGSWADVITAGNVVNDVYAIEILMSANNVTANPRDTLVDIGIDPAGGTAYQSLIPHLLASGAPITTQARQSISYVFPLFVKAGSSFGARASVNNATVGSLRVRINIYGLPSRPHLVKAGSFVRTFGQNTTLSQGQIVVAGTLSEGTWTQLGSASSEDLWWWQIGIGTNDDTQNDIVYAADIAAGDATNKMIILEDVMYSVSNQEVDSYVNPCFCYRTVKAGLNLYGRMWCNSTPDTDTSIIAYGVGG